MTKITSIANLATLAILSLACSTGCSLELGELKDFEWDAETSETGGPKDKPSSSETETETDDGTVPQSSEVYSGGTRILLPDTGISFDIPESLYGAGDRSAFDIGHEDWMGLVSVTGLEDTGRSDIEHLLDGTLDMGGGEYWVPMGAMESYEDATIVDYEIVDSTDGVTLATITALYGETGNTALLLGIGVESTIDDVMNVSDSVAASTAFSKPGA
jgi:hypothetical protein